MAVPPILLSGDHEEIAQWRKRQAVARTLAHRPDLLQESKRNGEQRG
jgi:tRNA (guanine37-N1)-methyltransferase